MSTKMLGRLLTRKMMQTAQSSVCHSMLYSNTFLVNFNVPAIQLLILALYICVHVAYSYYLSLRTFPICFSPSSFFVLPSVLSLYLFFYILPSILWTRFCIGWVVYFSCKVWLFASIEIDFV